MSQGAGVPQEAGDRQFGQNVTNVTYWLGCDDGAPDSLTVASAGGNIALSLRHALEQREPRSKRWGSEEASEKWEGPCLRSIA